MLISNYYRWRSLVYRETAPSTTALLMEDTNREVMQQSRSKVVT